MKTEPRYQIVVRSIGYETYAITHDKKPTSRQVDEAVIAWLERNDLDQDSVGLPAIEVNKYK